MQRPAFERQDEFPSAEQREAEVDKGRWGEGETHVSTARLGVPSVWAWWVVWGLSQRQDF